MPMSAATNCYVTDCLPVIARGLSFADDQLENILSGPVKDLLLDTSGYNELNSLLASLATTDFEQDGLTALLTKHVAPDPWLVGEAIAESFVTAVGNCIFPWPTSRDLKNPDASPTGADLTGFQKVNDPENPYRFAFGEVKTSVEEKYPPQVMYGRTGLKKQLEDLRDSQLTKQALVRYLGFHATNALWQDKYKSAVKRFLKSRMTDIAIFGVLVRDVMPDGEDLRCRAEALAKSCPTDTTIHLYAIYLPLKSVDILPQKFIALVQPGSSNK
ncbi:hypothetical protein [Comamonas aquatica]|uniref:hypothetical protein n=1 Tax=Comamonas aquatica TaxID=225991 RepID=UPI00244C7410|nr:hypothetical protein [Comamonas aquatica]MDH0382367.1 hypothetical protein [Comamonas aquatica]MDH0430510.1 hypothetical protein [Comamonas aquatica]MDH0941444.1 hypothetical protein [Comamonas aquatica]